MNYIHSILSCAFSLIAEPLRAAESGIEASTKMDPEWATPESNLSIKLMETRNVHAVTQVAADRIRAFLVERGFHRDRIKLIAGQSLLEDCGSPVAVRGSLGHEATAAIVLSSELIEQISENFTPKHQFVIAHELGHLIHGDPCRTAKIELGSCTFRLSAYAISLIALNTLCSQSVVTAHLVGCIASKIAGWFRKQQRFFAMELDADAWAAQQSSEIAEGGVEFFTELERKRVEHNQKLFDKWGADIKTSNSVVEKLSITAKVWCSRLFLYINKKVNLHPTHPPFSRRIALIQSTKR